MKRPPANLAAPSRRGPGTRVSRSLLFIAIVLMISGCVQPLTSSSFGSQGFAAGASPTIHRTVLPGLVGSEPDLAVGPAGRTILATAPTPGSSEELPLRGAAAWVSHDGGRTFELTLDPTAGPQDPVPFTGTCSCDSAGALNATTMVLATLVDPTLLTNADTTVNLMRSTDGGTSWDQRTPYAANATDFPDRPWITMGAGGNLFLTYGAEGPPSNPLGWSIIVRQSGDGGRSWTGGSTAWKGPAAEPMEPHFVRPNHLLVPVWTHPFTDSERRDWSVIILARSDDGGASFNITNVSLPFIDQAPLGFGMDVNAQGYVVVVWAGRSPSGTASWLRIRASHDLGRTWGPIDTLHVPGTAIQPNVALGPNGTTAIAYYDLDSTAPLADQGKDTNWTTRVALLDANLTVHRVLDVSPHRIYRGRPCPCTGSSFQRPLGDFLSVAWTPNGTLLVGYTDRSVHHDSSRDADLVVARIEGAASAVVYAS